MAPPSNATPTDRSQPSSRFEDHRSVAGILTTTSSRSHLLLTGETETDGMRDRRAILVATSFALVLAACGSGGGTATTTTTHGHAADHNLGDPGATPASQVPDAELTTGPFAILDDVDSETALSGQATMARHNSGTTVTIELRGLEPNTEYISHVHVASCSEAGGAHYKFDPDGDHHPPNEIHLAFTSDGSGHGFMTAENHQVATSEAASVVIHRAGPDSPKLACADLVPQG